MNNPVSLTKLRRYEQPKKHSTVVVFEVLLFIVILLLLMLALAAGVNSYKSISDQRQNDERDRIGLDLIANSVRMTDAIDAVGVGSGPEGQALVLSEYLASGTYETRIYEYQGNVVEEYAAAGTAYTPGRAMQLTESKTFSFSYANGLLTVHIDDGSAHIALRSVRQGATS